MNKEKAWPGHLEGPVTEPCVDLGGECLIGTTAKAIGDF